MAENILYSNDQIIQALTENNGLIHITAKKLGCDPKTIYNRAKKVRIVQQAIDDARAIVVDQAENKLMKAIDNGEAWAIALVLKTLGKNRGYVEKTELEQSGELVIRVVRDKNSPAATSPSPVANTK